MKTLLVVRHAKSSWEFPELPDHERPLTDKGKKRTKKVIDFLIAKDIKPDFVISSSALRARETARYISKALGYPKDDIKVDPALYHADAEQLFDQFMDISDAFQTLMIVGHNPALTNFVNCFLQPPIDWLPTSGVVCLSFDTIRWENIRQAGCNIEFVVFPKLLREEK
ncbi:MAG: histidine phosphatase family protein [Bacteroidales bacterium]|nr:histidine phosphatase family protein [Bacteroidales bacterium]